MPIGEIEELPSKIKQDKQSYPQVILQVKQIILEKSFNTNILKQYRNVKAYNISFSNTWNHTASTDSGSTPVNLDELPEDLVAPVIEHIAVTESEAYTDIVIEANVTDDLSAPYATLYFKNESDDNFTAISNEAT